MSHVITIRARYPGDANEIFARALSFQKLRGAMQGLAVYDGLPKTGKLQEGETYNTDIWFWGLLPVRNHTIHVAQLDPIHRRLETEEKHAGIRCWRHGLSVAPAGEGCLWSDRIEIDAGLSTPLVARFAKHVYTRRHRAQGASDIQSHLNR